VRTEWEFYLFDMPAAPADRFLQKLDQQPVPGAEVIVLSEHVDYWNHIGWKDPYSAHSYSERQSSYAKRFELDSVFTPQMVIDGSRQVVGSDTAAADRALAESIKAPKLPVHLALTSVKSGSPVFVSRPLVSVQPVIRPRTSQ